MHIALVLIIHLLLELLTANDELLCFFLFLLTSTDSSECVRLTITHRWHLFSNSVSSSHPKVIIVRLSIGTPSSAHQASSGRMNIRGGSGAEGAEALINPLLFAALPSPPLLDELFFPFSFLFPSTETGCHDNIEHSFHGERLSRLTASVTGDGAGNHLDLLSHLLE